MQKQHTVLCIQDLSCVGRCSLAVVLPALAAMGVQPCALPTALLSTHTGGLGRPARTDESGFISAALAHYAQLGLAFDCVYSGYLAGAAQVALVEQAFRQAPAALKLVDPVMADHGRPYASMTPEIRAAVAQLCGQADVIVPNALYAVSSSISLSASIRNLGLTERTPPAMHPFCCSAFPRCAAPW